MFQLPQNKKNLPLTIFFFFFFWKGSIFSNAGSDGTQPASCVDIQNRQSTYSCGCPMYGACQNDVFCGLFCSTTTINHNRRKQKFAGVRQQFLKKFGSHLSGKALGLLSGSSRVKASFSNVSHQKNS